MRIIVLENQPTRKRGGQELSLFELCRGLSQRGHQICLLYTQEGDLLPDYRLFCHQLIPIQRYEFDRRRLSEIWVWLQGLLAAGQQLSSFRKISQRESSETIVLTNQYNETFFGRVLASWLQAKLVCYLRIPPLSFTNQRRLGLKGVNRFVAVSQQTKQDWLSAGLAAEKISVVHNGTNLTKFYPASDRSNLRQNWNLKLDIPVISYVGRLDPEKGLESLIQAFAKLLPRYPQAQLLLAGKPLLHFDNQAKESPELAAAYLRSLQDLAVDLGVGEKVRFLGHVPNPAEIYQLSDVAVLPSLWSEPFGRVVIEAMACGTPVAGSRVGGIPEILTGEWQQGLFSPGNIPELTQALQSLIHQRQQDSRLSQRCREHVLAHFSLERTLDALETVLLQLSQPPTPRLTASLRKSAPTVIS